MDKPTLLIVTRNRACQLRSALESIQKQNYQNVKIVIVDDASYDETAEVLRDFSKLHMQIHRIERKGEYRRNPGGVLNVGHLGANSNIVIEQGGEICHLTNCVDSLLAVCRLGVVALAHVYHGEPAEMKLLKKDIDSGAYDFTDDFEPLTVETKGENVKGPRIGKHKILLYCGIERPVPFMFLGAIHRQDFDSVDGYNEELPDRADEDLANRLLVKGVRFCFVSQAVAFHLKHGKS